MLFPIADRPFNPSPPRRPVAAGVLGLAACCGFFAAAASAQQSSDMPAAVQPGYEILIARQEAMYMRLDDPRAGGAGTIDTYHVETTFAYGIDRDKALMLHVPVMHWDLENPSALPDADGSGIDDIPLMFQWRFLQQDLGAIDTRRAVLLAGVELPSYDPNFSSDSFDPLLGIAYTQIHGRHGFNASALWKFNTSADTGYHVDFGDSKHDAFKLDLAYLYRLAPEQYAADTQGSHYLQLQLLNRYETSGDTQSIFAPGWMYEGRRWAYEATLHLPIAQDLDHRAEMQWGVNLGIRYLF